MKKILAFAGSNNPLSINKQLVDFACTLIDDAEHFHLDMLEYPLPIFSSDLHKNSGLPENAIKLHSIITQYDSYIISIPEHNWSVTAFFKNTIDWLSVVDKSYKFFSGKPVLLMCASPGGGGGKHALEHGSEIITGLGAEMRETFSFPDFHKNKELFKDGIQNSGHALVADLKKKIGRLT